MRTSARVAELDWRNAPAPSETERSADASGSEQPGAFRRALPAQRGLQFSLTLLVLLVAIPAATISSVDRVQWHMDALGGVCIVGFAGYRLAELLVARRFAPVELTLFLYTYVFLGLAPWLQIMTGGFPWGGTYDSEVRWRSFVILGLGFIAYKIGLRSPLLPRASVQAAWQRRLSFNRACFGAVMSIALSALVVAYVGWDVVFASRADHSKALAEVAEGRGDLAFVMLADVALRAPVFAVSIVLVAIVSLGRRVRGSMVIVALVATVVNIAINNPISSPRAWFGAVVLSLVLIWLRRFGHRVASATYAAGVLVLFLIVFPYADAFRYASNVEDVQLEYVSVGEQIASNGDYSSFQQVMNAVLYADTHGFEMGRQFAGALLVWVPRSVWPDKPVDTAELVARAHNYEYTNVEMPMWAEFYVDGWLVAVALGFLALGLITRELDRSFSASEVDASGVPLSHALVPLVASYEPLLVRGDLMSTLSWFLVLVAVLYLQSYVPAVRRQRRPCRA